MSGNIHPYRRKRLESEITAVSIESAPDDAPIIVVNVDKRRTAALAALKKLRPHVLVPVLFGGVIEWLVRVARDRPVATAIAGTAAASAAIATGAAIILDGSERRPARPPVAIQIVTLSPRPAVTRTVTASATPTHAAALPPPTVKPLRPARQEPVRQEAALKIKPTGLAPTSSVKASRGPSPTPTKSEDRPQEDASPIPGNSPAPNAPSPLKASPGAPDSTQTAKPTYTQEAPQVMAAERCLIGIDLDPLLALCVAG